MATGRYIIIGAGNIGRRLIRLLSPDRELVLIDQDQAALDAVLEIRSNGITTVAGDATSRLVLERAGLKKTDTVLITATLEKINIEVARVVKEYFETRQVFAVGITRAGIAAMEQLGVEVENIFNVSATGLRNRLEHKTKTVHGIGLGKNEILEVEVHPNSRLANKTIARIRPRRWRIGLIYRDEALVIPRDDTVLKPEDKLIILGDPRVLKTVSEMLTFRFVEFPLEFGDRTLALFFGDEPEEYFAELAYILETFPLAQASLVLCPTRHSDQERIRKLLAAQGLDRFELRKIPLAELLADPALAPGPTGKVGLLVLSRTHLRHGAKSPALGWRRKKLLMRLSQVFRAPLLVSGGSYPYQRMALPCLTDTQLQASMQTALEIASPLNFNLEALVSKPSEYIAADSELKGYEGVCKTIDRLRHIYRIEIRETQVEGNPITALTAALKDHKLLVANIGEWRRPRLWPDWLDPDVPWHVVDRAGISTLLLPADQETL
ncbi:MAG: trk/ktr system potassium uptake protein [Desulfuromonadales bacterium]|jgi:Trk K+ transport system NAD-binding subunit|nr:trk/ktr system potassium uptake protein [Desulfuromonadales bacterium]